jgi:peptidyl-prolyl cis-trans isomerase SurA
MTFRRLVALVPIALACLAGRPAMAQQVDGIAAIVNTQAITFDDVTQRVRMAMVLSRLPDTMAVRRRVVPQVLRKMIDEDLETQEAKRLKITISPQRVTEGIRQVERQNHMPPGALEAELKQAGIDPALIRRQIGAELLWLKVASERLGPTITVGDEEINEQLQAIKAHEGKPEYLLTEIYLPVESPGQDENVQRLGERLIDQLRQGAPFSVLASQFSQSPTAANGGAMGWVAADTMDGTLLKAVENMTPGHITPLVRTREGYYIIGMIARRIAGQGGPSPDATVSVAQMTLPVPANGPPMPALIGRAMQITQGAASCDDFEALGHRLKALGVGRIKPTPLPQLSAPVRQAVANLAQGAVARPIDTPAGLRIYMMCSRSDAGAHLPSRAEIRRMIENQRLEMLTRRYLRDLRRNAYIRILM